MTLHAYTFTFPVEAAGLDVSIADAAGQEVSTDTLGSEPDASGVLSLVASLASGDYTATAELDTSGIANRNPLTWRVYPDRIECIGLSLGPRGDAANTDTDGVGAVFFGGSALSVDFNNTTVYTDFVVSDDPPRAPQRDDLVVVDGGDDTTINVVRSGLYDITINTPLGLQNVVFDDEVSDVIVRAEVHLEINGANEPPAYDYNNRAYWIVRADGLQPSVAANLTFAQELVAGDTIQLGFKVTQAGLVNVSGTLHLDPDITMVMTYRGPVSASVGEGDEGGGGGGIDLAAEPVYVECNAGQTLLNDGSTQQILFDSFGDFTPGTGGSFMLPAGFYQIDWQVNFAEPDANWTIQFTLVPNGAVDGPRPIQPGVGGDPWSHRASGQITFGAGEAAEIGGSLRITPVDDAVDPTPLEITYAALVLTKRA